MATRFDWLDAAEEVGNAAAEEASSIRTRLSIVGICA